MKKKILLTLTIISLIVVVFALSVSASDFIDFSEFGFCDTGYVDYSCYLNNSNGFDSSVEDKFGVVRFSCSDCTSIAYGFLNIEWWHTYLTGQNVDNEDDFRNAILNLISIGAIADTANGISYETQSNAYIFYPIYEKYVAELNSPTYEDGLKDGVDNYKQSEAFQIRLEMEKDLGRSEGKADFISSDEYKTLLDEEYDKGFSDGAAEDGGSVVGTTVTSILGVGVLLIVLLTVANAISKKRKKR